MSEPSLRPKVFVMSHQFAHITYGWANQENYWIVGIQSVHWPQFMGSRLWSASKTDWHSNGQALGNFWAEFLFPRSCLLSNKFSPPCFRHVRSFQLVTFNVAPTAEEPSRWYLLRTFISMIELAHLFIFFWGLLLFLTGLTLVSVVN